MPQGQDSQALLYSSMDRRCRAGAPVKYLSHSATLQTWERLHHQSPGNPVEDLQLP
jgi:hypothetical protein